MDAFTSKLVSPTAKRSKSQAVASPAVVAQEWMGEHLLKKHSEKDAEARLNRQVAEKLAEELKSKCDLTTQLQSRIIELELQLSRNAEAMEAVNEIRQSRDTLFATAQVSAQEIESLQHQLAQRNDYDTLKEKLSEKQNEIAKQSDAYQHLLGVSQKVASQNQILNTEAERLGSMVPELQRECEALKEHAVTNIGLRSETQRLNHLAEMVPRLATELETLRIQSAKIEPLQTEKALLMQACEQMSDDIPHLNNKIQQLATENAQIPSLKEEIENLSSVLTKNKMLEQEVDRLHNIVKDASTVRQECERLQAIAQRVPLLESEIAAERIKSGQTVDVTRSRDHLAALLEERDRELERVQKNSKMQLEMHTSKLTEQKATIDNLERGVRERDQLATTHIENVVTPLSDECESLKRRLKDSEVVLSSERTRHQSDLQRLTAATEIEKAAVRKQLLEQQSLHQQEKQALEQALARRSEHNKQEVVLLQELVTKSKQIATERQSEHDDLLAKKDHEIATLVASNRKLEKENNDVTTRLQLTIKGMTAMQQDSDKERLLEDEVRKLRAEVGEKNLEIDSLQNALNAALASAARSTPVHTSFTQPTDVASTQTAVPVGLKETSFTTRLSPVGGQSRQHSPPPPADASMNVEPNESVSVVQQVAPPSVGRSYSPLQSSTSLSVLKSSDVNARSPSSSATAAPSSLPAAGGHTATTASVGRSFSPPPPSAPADGSTSIAPISRGYSPPSVSPSHQIDHPNIAPPRYSISALAPTPAEVCLLRKHMTYENLNIEQAARETDSLGFRSKNYWSEDDCRRTRIWMSQPPQF